MNVLPVRVRHDRDALLSLTAFGELGRVVGEKKLHALFLRPREASTPLGQQMV